MIGGWGLDAAVLGTERSLEPAGSGGVLKGRVSAVGESSCAHVPDDLSPHATLTALDVYPSASYARSLGGRGEHVLGADAIGSQAQLIIPNGLTDDRGEYALELLRRTPALLAAFEG